MKNLVTACAALLLVTQSAFGQQERTWTDDSGQHQIQATFVRMDGNDVYLKRSDTGEEIALPLNRLSQNDQIIARELADSNSSSDSSAEMSETDIFDDIRTEARLEWSEFPSFDENGNESYDLELVVEALGSPAKEAVKYGMFNIEVIEGRDGAAVGVKEDRFSMDDIESEIIAVQRPDDDFFNDHPDNGIRCRMELSADDNLREVSSLRGSFKMVTGATVHKIVIPDVTSLIDGEVRNEQLEQLGISVTFGKSEDGQLTVDLEGDISSVLETRPCTSDGSEHRRQQGSFWSTMEASASYGFEFSDQKIPGDLHYLIVFAEGGTEVTIPFEFSDIRVPRQR